MPIALLRAPVLVVPGFGDGRLDHWRELWRAGGGACRQVAVPEADPSRLDAWAAAVARAIDACEAAPIVVAHGFGALAALRAAWLFEREIAAALLVAPADPDRLGVTARLPARPLPYPSLLVATSDDPTLKLLKAGALATRWGSRFVPLQYAPEGAEPPTPASLRLIDQLQSLASARDPGIGIAAADREGR